jgi:hypothetical protein
MAGRLPPGAPLSAVALGSALALVRAFVGRIPPTLVSIRPGLGLVPAVVVPVAAVAIPARRAAVAFPVRTVVTLVPAAPISAPMALVLVPPAPVLVVAGAVGAGRPTTVLAVGTRRAVRAGGRDPDPLVRAGPVVGPAPPGSLRPRRLGLGRPRVLGPDGSRGPRRLGPDGAREGRARGRLGAGVVRRVCDRRANHRRFLPGGAPLRRPGPGGAPRPRGAPARRGGRGTAAWPRPGLGSREPPVGGFARPRPGGSTWMTPGTPRSGTGGSSGSATGWANDSTRSSLVATIAASDVAASDATPRATTTEALRRDDTRGDPLRRRWTGG